MDIRKFFGKADGKKKADFKAKPTPAANASSSSGGPKRPKVVPSKRKEEAKSAVKSQEETPATASSKSSASGKNQTTRDEDPKENLGKQERVEVSPKDFFSQEARSKATITSPKKKKQEEEDDWIKVSKDDIDEEKPSPTKKQKKHDDLMEVSTEDADSKPEAEMKKEKSLKPVPKKKRRLVIEDDEEEEEEDDDDVPFTVASNKKAKRIVLGDEDSDYVTDEVEASHKPKPTPTQKPAKKSPPSSKRKTQKDEHKERLIHPDLRLTSFSTDDAVPECLIGTTFVFSGVLENLSRTAAEDFVKSLGGRVTSAVSGKTDYLVVGDELEDGRPYTEGSKYRKAMENGVIIVQGEESLYGLGKMYSDRAKVKLPTNSPMPVAAPTDAKPAAAKMPSNPYAKCPANPYAKSDAAKAGTTSNPYAKTSALSAPPPALALKVDPTMLWADKYAPQSTRDVLGNQENVRKLSTWVACWETTFLNPKAKGKTFSSPNGPWKAALLSGPPGIGKTTAATLVVKESGRDVLELNASDARSKKALSQGFVINANSSTLLNFVSKDGKRAEKRCIIMDEVDGMGAGDRSGMAELIKTIKGSTVPIICICNDRQSQKVKSLATYCLDLRFRRPVKSVIARRVIEIGQQEGMKVEMNAAETIAESCGNDVRQVLNCLQMWASKEGSSMTYKDLKDRQSSINKDEILRVSMFDATKIIVEGRRGLSGAEPKAEIDSIYKRSDAFFVDYSFMGLMVHQNYPKVLMGQYTGAKQAKDERRTLAFLEQMYEAAAAMSDYAVAEQAVRGGDQNWSLLPFAGMMTVKTGYHAGGENGGFLTGFPEFTGWMGKNSSRAKKTRLLQELCHHMNYKISGDSTELRMTYLPFLRAKFAALLTAPDGPNTDEAIQLMDEYGLDRDDLFENLDEFKMDSKAKPFANILDSKEKAAFTRAYNKVAHKSQALVDEQGRGKTNRVKSSSSNLEPKDPEVVDDDKEAESDDDDNKAMEAEKEMELFRKKGAKNAAKNSSASKKSSGKGKKKN